MSLTRLALLSLPALLLAACGGKDEDDTADSGETGDTGETGETGQDSVPVNYVDFDGSMTYVVETNGSRVCDADITLSGTPYEGDCEDCDFAFAIDAQITRDDGTDDCYYYPFITFIPDEVYTDLWIQHFPVYEYGAYNLYNYVQSGFYYYGYGPYYFTLGYGGGFAGRTTFRNDVLDLDFYYYAPGYLGYNARYYDACGEKLSNSTETQPHEGVAMTSRLACDQTKGDVWTFDVAEGTDIAVTIDTVADESAFSPLLLINDPSACTVGFAQDNFMCEYPPPTYLCPVWAQARASAGRWSAIVLSNGSCNGAEGEYEIRVEGGTGLTLAADDFDAFELLSDSFKLTCVMSATVTPE